MIAEPCACGGWIEAPSLEESAVVVWEHNQTTLHQLWRNSGGVERMAFPREKVPVLPTTGPWDAYEHRAPCSDELPEVEAV